MLLRALVGRLIEVVCGLCVALAQKGDRRLCRCVYLAFFILLRVRNFFLRNVLEHVRDHQSGVVRDAGMYWLDTASLLGEDFPRHTPKAHSKTAFDR